MKIFKFVFVIFGFIFTSFANASGDTSNSDSILDKVQRNYKNIKTIEAKFLQDSHSEALGQEEKSSGLFKALIPNNIKVAYCGIVKIKIISLIALIVVVSELPV